MRTLQDALDRAKSLRDFKVASPERFEKCPDFQDIVALADEVTTLMFYRGEATLKEMEATLGAEDDHTESW